MPPCRSRRASVCEPRRRNLECGARTLETSGAECNLLGGEPESGEHGLGLAQAHPLEAVAIVARVFQPIEAVPL